MKTGSIVLGALMLVGSVLSIGDSAKDILNGGSKLDFSDFDLTYYQQHRLNTLRGAFIKKNVPNCGKSP